jgi:hypothetical protein
METSQTTPGNPTNDSSRVEKMLAEYERAQDIGHHTDTVIHEITAIVWGANTLLLGFILEVNCDSDNQKLVIVAAVVGLVMSVYAPLVMYWTKKGQRIAYAVCRKIENELPLAHRLNNLIHEEYSKRRPGQVAVWVLTVIFVLAWFYVGVHAYSCLHRPPSSTAPIIE